MPKPGEHKTVQSRILEYAHEIERNQNCGMNFCFGSLSTYHYIHLNVRFQY